MPKKTFKSKLCLFWFDTKNTTVLGMVPHFLRFKSRISGTVQKRPKFETRTYFEENGDIELVVVVFEIKSIWSESFKRDCECLSRRESTAEDKFELIIRDENSCSKLHLAKFSSSLVSSFSIFSESILVSSKRKYFDKNKLWNYE